MLFVPIYYSHHRKEIHPASIHPFWARIHAMPGSKAVIVLKATRPTASCLEHWVEHQERARRKPGLNSKRWYSSTQSWRRLLLGGQKKRPKGGAKSPLGSIRGCVVVVVFSHRGKAHTALTWKVTGGHRWIPIPRALDFRPQVSAFPLSATVGHKPTYCGQRFLNDLLVNKQKSNKVLHLSQFNILHNKACSLGA